MSDYSQIITLANLNTVYEDIRHRIDALGGVYSPKGSKTCEELKELLNDDKLEVGDVYNVIIDKETSIPGVSNLKDGDNVVCIKNNDNKSWAKLGGVYELANNTTAGLVFLGEDTDFDNTEANKTITSTETGYTELGLNMGNIDSTKPEDDSSSSIKTFVKVPFASDKKYGLVSTEEQSFSGNKTFKNSSNSNYYVTIKTVDGSKATSEIEIANKSASASTRITPTSISVGGNGSTATGTLNINSGNTVANSAEFGILQVNGTATVAKDATFKSDLEVTGDTTIKETSSLEGGLTVTGLTTATSLVTTNIYSSKSTSNKTEPYIIADKITTAELTVGTKDANGDVIEGELNVEEDLTVNILDAPNATLTINGTTASAKSLDVEGTLKVTDTSTSSAEVNKLTASDATLTVEGDKVTANTLDVTGNLTVNSSATIGTAADNDQGLIIVHGRVDDITRPTGEVKDVYYSNDTLKDDCNITISTNGGIFAGKVFNAVWNDLADSIEVPEDTELEYGYCYSYLDGKVFKSNKKADAHVLGIHSDTAGMVLGTKPGKCIDLAVAGIVLAYVDKEYISGTPLVATKEGKLTKAPFFTRILHPERIVATFYKKETLDKWGSKEGSCVIVNGRCWVKVR